MLICRQYWRHYHAACTRFAGEWAATMRGTFAAKGRFANLMRTVPASRRRGTRVGLFKST